MRSAISTPPAHANEVQISTSEYTISPLKKAARELLGYPHATTQGQQLRGQYFLHRACRPLDEVDLDPPVPAKRQLRLVSTKAVEEDDPDGCSPWSCRTGAPVTEERAASQGCRTRTEAGASSSDRTPAGAQNSPAA